MLNFNITLTFSTFPYFWLTFIIKNNILLFIKITTMIKQILWHPTTFDDTFTIFTALFFKMMVKYNYYFIFAIALTPYIRPWTMNLNFEINKKMNTIALVIDINRNLYIYFFLKYYIFDTFPKTVWFQKFPNMIKI